MQPAAPICMGRCSGGCIVTRHLGGSGGGGDGGGGCGGGGLGKGLGGGGLGEGLGGGGLGEGLQPSKPVVDRSQCSSAVSRFLPRGRNRRQCHSSGGGASKAGALRDQIIMHLGGGGNGGGGGELTGGGGLQQQVCGGGGETDHAALFVGGTDREEPDKSRCNRPFAAIYLDVGPPPFTHILPVQVQDPMQEEEVW